MQRRHGRELVRKSAIDAAVPVARRSEDARGVDETEALQHAGRCQRIERVTDEPERSNDDEYAACRQVPKRLAHVEPYKERDRDEEVRVQVIDVEELDDRRALKRDGL